MAGLLREYLAEIAKTVGDPGSIRARAAEKREDGPKSGLREGRLLGMLLSPRQREIVGSIQAVMSLMEGYSNHAMRNTGAGLIPGYAALDRRMRRREQSRGPAFNVFARLLGLEMKLAQYRLGEKFVNRIVERGGIDLLNRAWISWETLPTLDEIERPEDWIQRINAGA
jgi:putative hydrolase